MRGRFDEQLEQLNSLMIETGAMCESAIASAAKALLEGDDAYARRAAAKNDAIAQQERLIEPLCLTILMQQQPSARDLRQVSSALKAVTDMVRIGQLANDVARLGSAGNIDPAGETFALRQMATDVIAMVTDAVDAWVHRDDVLALATREADAAVDTAYVQTKVDVADAMERGALGAVGGLDLFLAAKHLERIGDHAVNIAGWVVFAVSGTHAGEEPAAGSPE